MRKKPKNNNNNEANPTTRGVIEGETTVIQGTPHPAPDYLLVQRAGTPNVTEGGIQVVVQREEVLSFGRIYEVGANCTTYQQGQFVILSPFGGFTVDLGGILWTFIREKDIIGTIGEHNIKEEL